MDRWLNAQGRKLALALVVVAAAGTARAYDERPIESSRTEEVGNKKTVETKATLYRNGTLVVEQYGRNRHPTEGLRPRTIVVIAAGPNALWVSAVKGGGTLSSTLDPTGRSSGKKVFEPEFIPPVICQAATRMDIYSFDGDRATSWRDQTVGNIKDAIRSAKDVSAEVKQAVAGLK
jgi:hypothetical protein